MGSSSYMSKNGEKTKKQVFATSNSFDKQNGRKTNGKVFSFRMRWTRDGRRFKKEEGEALNYFLNH